MSTRCPAQVKRTAVTGRSSLWPPTARLALVGPAEERERRPQQDLRVHEPGAVLHVPDVELDPLLPGKRGAPVDLGPAGQAGLDLEALALPLRVALDLIGEGRPRPDEAHVAAQDVPDLRQLVGGQPPGAPAGPPGPPR